MRRTMMVVALLALAIAALPGVAAAKTVAFKGTVVKKSAAPKGVVVAQRSGRLRLVRTAAKLRVGRVVAIRGALLTDQSVRATRVRRFGLARRVKVRGVVLGRTRSLVTVASGGASVSIHRRTTASLHGGSAGASGGSVVEDCTINHGGLHENGTLPAGAAAAFEVHGTVVSAGNGKLALSVDGVLLTIGVPSTLDVSGLTPGTIVEVKVAVATDPTTGAATLTLIRFESEDGNNGHEHGHHHHHGHHRGFEITGTVTLPTTAGGALTVTNAGGAVTFNSTQGVDLTGITAGQCVEAKGETMQDGSLALARIEPSNDCATGGGGMGGNTVTAHGTLAKDSPAAGQITVNGTVFTVGSVDVTAFANGDCVDASGTAQSDGTNALDTIAHSTCS